MPISPTGGKHDWLFLDHSLQKVQGVQGMMSRMKPIVLLKCS